MGNDTECGSMAPWYRYWMLFEAIEGRRARLQICGAYTRVRSIAIRRLSVDMFRICFDFMTR